MDWLGDMLYGGGIGEKIYDITHPISDLGESEPNVCEMRERPPRWDPGDPGPLINAPGISPDPIFDPNRPPKKPKIKKPKNWNELSNWQKTKWYTKTYGRIIKKYATWAIGQGFSMGNWH